MKLKLKKKTSIAIFYRKATPTAVALAKALSEWLQERGHKVFTGPEQKQLPKTKVLGIEALGKMDLIIVLGGDGTYLRAVRLLNGKSIPILGIHQGSLGFLTPTRADEAFSAIENTLKGKMDLIPRSMLQFEVYRKQKKVASGLALNDCVIERGNLSQLINISIASQGIHICDVKADGLIISTPTGSTAYNLAAGGPIVHPQVKTWVITPIASHSLNNRPLLMPDDRELTFELVGKLHPNLQSGHLIVDGEKVLNLNNSDEIKIRRSATDHWMVKESRTSYFHLLREKLKFGERD